jgi:hypothetical protein
LPAVAERIALGSSSVICVGELLLAITGAPRAAPKPLCVRGRIVPYAEHMARREYLGEFGQIVLLAVLRLGEDAYGVPFGPTLNGEPDDR